MFRYLKPGRSAYLSRGKMYAHGSPFFWPRWQTFDPADHCRKRLLSNLEGSFQPFVFQCCRDRLFTIYPSISRRDFNTLSVCLLLKDLNFLRKSFRELAKMEI